MTSIFLFDRFRYIVIGGITVENIKKPFYKKWWFIVIVAIVIIAAIGNAGSEDNETAEQEEDKVTTSSESNENKETPEEKAEREAKEAEEKALAEQKAKEEAEAKAKEEEAAKAKAEAERLAKLEALKISGTGDTVTKKFALESGFVIVNATHQGSRNFIAYLYDANGDSDLAINTIGNYNGATAYWVEEGEYLFEVTADGSWTIQMSQEIPSDEQIVKDGVISGSGDDVIFLTLEKGLKTVTATHNGRRNFIAYVNDDDLLVNEIGVYEGSSIFTVPEDNIYFVNVQADGAWTIKFE